MSGPGYPPGPRPGSNSIGSFTIGVSPMGDINPFDVWTTIISQYANSETLTRLIVNMSQYIDMTKNLNDFFDLVFNVDTAEGWGLDVWGRIVGVSRTIFVVNSDSYFGFEEADEPTEDGFGSEPFYSGAPVTDNFRLSDPAFRTLIFAKALANICDGSIPSTNQIMLNLFPGRGDCFVTDGGESSQMTMTYTFQFALSAVELAIVEQTGALPKPVGVAATVVQNY